MEDTDEAQESRTGCVKISQALFKACEMRRAVGVPLTVPSSNGAY